MVFRVGQRGAAFSAFAVMAMATPAGAQVTTPAPVPEPMLDPSAPLAALPGIGVDWPDLSQPSATSAPAAQASQAADVRYIYRLDGIDAVESSLMRQRFDDASTLRAHQKQPANAAQLDRRAREDATLLTDLLRAAGYYDARVTTRVEPGDRLTVVLQADPGTVYRFRDVTVAGLDAAGGKAGALRDAFGLRADDPVNSDTIAGAEAKLRDQIGRRGFPFAKVGDPDIVVDHATHTATLALAVDPGSDRRFGRITVNPNRVFGADHIAQIARFVPGQSFDQTALDDLRRALIQTGLVSVAEVKPVAAADPGVVDVAVTLERAPPRTIAGELGYGTGEGARAEIDWTHRNLFPPEGALTVRGVLGTQEQLGAVIFRRNNFRARDRVLTAQLSASHTRRTAYDARTFDLSAQLEKQTNIFFQKAWTWSFGGELVATDEQDVIAATGQPRRRTYFIAAAPTSLNYDGSDDLLNPSRGFRLGARLSPELSLEDHVFGYTRAQLDASAYHPITEKVVLAGRIRLGTIFGAPRDQVAPSRRFYAGGGASVRGYAYQAIGPRDPNNDPIGGRSVAEIAAEARVRLFGAFGLVPFVDAGNIYTAELPDFSGLRVGTGLGVRYYSNFGPIRVDVGTPVNPQRGDPRVSVYVSLGQAF